MEFTQFQFTESNIDWTIELKSRNSTLDNSEIFCDDISTTECWSYNPFLEKLRIGNQLDIHTLTEILLRLSKHTFVHQRVKILTKYSCS